MRILTGLLLASVGALAADTVFVARHAERAGGMGNEVGISEAGQCRAEGLARLLADAGVKAIFTSEVARTQQTAAPVAKKLGITTEAVPAKDVAGVVAKVRSARGNVLVVGHSNTVPEIVKQLSGTAVPEIADTEFDRLCVVTLAGPKATVVLLRYPGCAP